jgi:ATP-binding cassette subfamily F protein 3
MLDGSEPLTAGEYVLGHNAQPDYFAQDQYKVLDPERRMLDDIEQVAPRSTMTELRNLLGCFLFSDDDVFKQLGVLSGGERNRYALARMLLHPSNFLLLDEPTNHLDLRAKDVLLNALQEFSGTVVFVSHDRYFIDKLATRVFEVGDGKVEVFPGNYADYLWRKQGGPEIVKTTTNGLGAEASNASTPAPNGLQQPEPESRHKRVNPIKLQQMKKRAGEIEEEITKLEAGITECEQALQNFVSLEETTRLTDLLATRRTELTSLMREWEEISAGIESA